MTIMTLFSNIKFSVVEQIPKMIYYPQGILLIMKKGADCEVGGNMDVAVYRGNFYRLLIHSKER